MSQTPLAIKPVSSPYAWEDRLYRIGEIAERLGITLRTLRFYEEKKLIVPRRTMGAHRCYAKADILRLEFILACRHIGLSVDATRAILEAVDAEPLSSAPLLVKLRTRLAEIEANRRTLEEQYGTIARWLADLESEGSLIFASDRSKTEAGQ